MNRLHETVETLQAIIRDFAFLLVCYATLGLIAVALLTPSALMIYWLVN